MSRAKRGQPSGLGGGSGRAGGRRGRAGRSGMVPPSISALASRKPIPGFKRRTSAMPSPLPPHPKHFHRFPSGRIDMDGFGSSWNGQCHQGRPVPPLIRPGGEPRCHATTSASGAEMGTGWFARAGLRRGFVRPTSHPLAPPEAQQNQRNQQNSQNADYADSAAPWATRDGSTRPATACVRGSPPAAPAQARGGRRSAAGARGGRPQ